MQKYECFILVTTFDELHIFITRDDNEHSIANISLGQTSNDNFFYRQILVQKSLLSSVRRF